MSYAPRSHSAPECQLVWTLTPGLRYVGATGLPSVVTESILAAVARRCAASPGAAVFQVVVASDTGRARSLIRVLAMSDSAIGAAAWQAPSVPSDRTTALLVHVALWALMAHAASNAISAVAFGTFLVEPYPAWIATPRFLPWLEFGLLWGGQLTVLIGAVAGWAFLASRLGLRATNVAFVWIFVLTMFAELAGTHTGFPFGVYAYSERLGYRVLGLVPFSIPTSWFYMLVACLGLCARLLPAKDDGTSRWWWSLIGGALLTAWDVVLDPAMVKTWHWRWTPPDLSEAHPLVRFIGEPIFFGMPITNWMGWLLTGVLVSRVMLWLIPPTTWRRAVAPYRFPMVLYALNGLLPIAICLRQDMVPAGLLGLLVMGVPVWLAWRAPLPFAPGIAGLRPSRRTAPLPNGVAPARS